ncbi:TldD/PmbA family protein [Clostridium sp. KNHs214]|uniref:TldD/PmbA family protein n=1 Tax=Clostridium sp. KNHs214 TaxID=1540257 RepID=UPI0005565146|nr:TldD/PmbA family protein [Clostridium sp. KNHs214]
MKVQLSNFLTKSKPTIKQLVSILSKHYKYVSILGSDTSGKAFNIRRTSTNLNDSFWNERGFVLRVHNGINYSELSFNQIDNNVEHMAKSMIKTLDNQLNNLKNLKTKISPYPIIKEEKLTKTFNGNVNLDFSSMSNREILEKMSSIKDEALVLSEFILDFIVSFQSVKVSKIFISSDKDLEQSYIWSEATLASIARKDSKTKFYYKVFSGLKGLEILDEMKAAVKLVVDTSVELLNSNPVKPGEYEVICAPSVSGIIAHEAFGHGVEMDMFVKNRAKAKEYMNKEVASSLVTMHDGSRSCDQVSSYLFDDEGVLGGDTIVIDKGILKSGFSDTLSALKLNIKSSGNGKRESFERKAYARMTNTFFESGNDNLEDMISSIKYGFLLECPSSGMEDPKNWGIQCMVTLGREIKDGKLTGRLVSPVILTGYVPDLLKSISMVSKNVELEGSGACGKGYKEYVKVSCGGPYIKAKVRLG